MTESGSVFLGHSPKRFGDLAIAWTKSVPIAAAFLSLAFSVPGFVKTAHAACSSKPAQGVDWAGCRTRNLLLSGNDLRQGKFRQTDFAASDMRMTKADAADFTKAVLIRAVFDQASAREAIFDRAIGYRASFQYVDLSDAVFRKSELTRVNFTGSTLTGADFLKSDAGRITLDRALMGNNDFSYSNIARADFRKAVIKGVIVVTGAFSFQARFEGVDLTNFQGLQQRQVDMACGNDATVLPEGLHRPARWSCPAQ